MVTPNNHLFAIFHLGNPNEILLTEKFVVIVHCHIVFFKMHSYLLTNLDLREAYFNQKSALKPDQFKQTNDSNAKNFKYPYNITMKDYIRYLIIPGVVYEEKFPTTPKFKPVYFLGHATLVIMNIFVQYILFTDNVLPILENPHLRMQLYE